MSIYYLRMRNATVAKSSVLHYGYMTATEVTDELKHCTRGYAQKQEEVVAYETVIPDQAPREFLDPQKLWNSVQKNETLHGNGGNGTARTYKGFVIGLPMELTREEQIEAAKAFAEKLRSDGMCVSWAIHDPHKKVANPHIHVMATVRPLDAKGQWTTKEKKVYAIDANGEKIPEIDKKTGLQRIEIRRKKLADGTVKEYQRKVWKRMVVDGTGFNSREKLNEWKKAWADIVNPYLEDSKKVDYRSYQEQGKLRIPEKHEGYYERKMDAVGLSDVCDENRTIRQENENLSILKRDIFKSIETLKNLFNEVKDYVYRSGVLAESGKEPGRAGSDDRSHETIDRPTGGSKSGGADSSGREQEIEVTELQITRQIEDLKKGQEEYAERARELLTRRAATIIGGAAGNMRAVTGGERAVPAGQEGLGTEGARPGKKVKHKSLGL